MPYKSEAQRKFFHANKSKLQAQGVDVSEYDKASVGLKLPIKINKNMKNVSTKKTADKFQPKKVVGKTAKTKKWEGSKADKANDKRLGYKEGSKKDNAMDKKMQKKMNGKKMLGKAMSKLKY